MSFHIRKTFYLKKLKFCFVLYFSIFKLCGIYLLCLLPFLYFCHKILIFFFSKPWFEKNWDFFIFLFECNSEKLSPLLNNMNMHRRDELPCDLKESAYWGQCCLLQWNMKLLTMVIVGELIFCCYFLGTQQVRRDSTALPQLITEVPRGSY